MGNKATSNPWPIWLSMEEKKQLEDWLTVYFLQVDKQLFDDEKLNIQSKKVSEAMPVDADRKIDQWIEAFEKKWCKDKSWDNEAILDERSVGYTIPVQEKILLQWVSEENIALYHQSASGWLHGLAKHWEFYQELATMPKKPIERWPMM